MANEQKEVAAKAQPNEVKAAPEPQPAAASGEPDAAAAKPKPVATAPTSAVATVKPKPVKAAQPRPVATTAKVVNLSQNPPIDYDQPARTRPQIKRRRRLALSFILMVLIPGALCVYYYAAVASDRYVSGAGFAVRGMDAGGGLDVVGAFTGLASSGSTTSDSYIVLQYLKSRDLVEQLQSDLDVRAAFIAETIDPLSRMDSAATVEDFVDYWDGMIATTFDSTSGVITFEVQAFDPVAAKKIADLVFQYTQSLVNRLSEKARQDSVRFAEAEVARSEARLRDALEQVRRFREKEQSLNPAASAQLQIELVSALESQLVDIRARMSALSQSVDANAPSLVAMRRQAEALEAQIAEKTNGMSGTADRPDAGMALTGLLAAFETLEVEKSFAEQAYASALSSREQARVEADRQQRYLAAFSYPALPEAALYPHRVTNSFLVIATLFCFWGISTLIVYSVRDHLS